MYNNPNQPPQPPYGQPPFQQGPQAPYGQPSYGVDGIPSISETAPSPQRKSRKTLWVVLSIVGGILVLGCIACGLFVSGIFKIGSQAAAPVVAISQYYEALKAQNYPQAYTYLDPSELTVGGQTVTPTLYAAAEASIDKQFGPVTDYKLTDIKIQKDTATITVEETRNQTRTITYPMKRVGNDWKISVPANGQGLPTTTGG